MKDWWGKQAAIATSLGVLAMILCIAMGAAWVRDVSEARQSVYAAPEASCGGDQNECAEKDLPAQVRAARAGEALVDLAVWQLIVSAVALLGIVGLFWNIVQGHAALAKAREANEIARRSSERQLRAYLSIDQVYCVGVEAGKHPVIWMSIKNRGQTPARNIRIKRAVIRCHTGKPDAVRITDLTETHIFDLGPDQPTTQYEQFTTQPLTVLQAHDILHGDVVHIFAGYIRYTDVFGRTRRNVFRAHLAKDSFRHEGKAYLSLGGRHFRST
ncbi:hypothetical protein [Brevundimonas sp. UBA7664]|uniref:hypothetical protein n=1 Tax=Brevundimonas sp. UBA7664 TaxID=1946141 RepID=UPI0025C4DBE3|nr:hypothetical protein [Brevundimonas sp. UBA7664]